MEKEFKIQYTSDIHGYFSPVDYASGNIARSGLARCASAFEKDGNTLVIDGGDILSGSPLTSYLQRTKGNVSATAASVMNACGYDFVTLGNHDFDFGVSAVENYLSALDAKCLCANVTNIAGVKPMAMVQLENGLKVGLTGVITDMTPLWESPEKVAGVVFSDPLKAAASTLERLKAMGAELTICIYHGGFERDLKTGRVLSTTGEDRAYELCEKLGFDILLTGHRHTAMEGKELFETFACQPPDRASSFIQINGVVEEDGRHRIESKLLPPAEIPLASVTELLKEAEEGCSQWLDTPVGGFDRPLEAGERLDTAINGSYVADFINLVQLDRTGAEISATGLGNEISGFNEKVTVRDIVSTYVFPNTLKVIEVDRSVLKAALERVADYFTLRENEIEISEAFLKPSPQHYNFDFFFGIETVLDLKKPEGSRVISILYQGEELTEGRKLRLALNNYRASGAGGYDCYENCPLLYDGQDSMTDILTDYISTHPHIHANKTKWINIIK